ncbi:sugar kinase [Lichenicola sp.]|uniref:sugar kinase n=1 Tax=Lichenicola sp. TaxID=2804529 RepID=UPI003B00F72E
MKTLVAIGECMVEVAPAGADSYSLGYAGDTFNAAWASRVLLPASHAVRYVTAVGTDWVSDEMVAFMAQAGLDVSAVRRDPVRSVGLYAVRLVEGERSFAYWRSNSAATSLADDPSALALSLQGADIVLFSGITLAILSEAARETLFTALVEARRNGTRIAFDPNHRPRLWPSDTAARDTLTAFCRIVDCVLPSFSDEAALFGDASPSATAARFAELGVSEIVVKNGPDPALCVVDGVSKWIPARPVEHVLDTTGAGDAFNGAYLAGRLEGLDALAAVARGHQVAAVSVQTRGALIPTGSRLAHFIEAC